MTNQVIPAQAVEALAAVLAQEALVSADMDGYGWDAENDDPAPFMPRARERAHTYLEAAAPYMQAEALEDAAAAIERDEDPRDKLTIEWMRNRAAAERGEP